MPMYADCMKVVAKNKKARFDYEILEEIEAGILLTGQEVKSAREGNMDLKGAYVSMMSGSPVLKNATIQPYRFASNLGDYDPGRDRELLVHKKQSARLFGLAEDRSGRTIKVLIGAGRGRKKIDKRNRIKERDIEKRMRRGDDI